ncbi:MAG TPA: ribosomal L7Ae/L30e/S12e/Gadd45 family protein [Longimicrobiales bacterium]
MTDRSGSRAGALLQMLGLAARAGAVVPGTDRVREAARNGSLRIALVAADASENSRDKLLPLLQSRQIPYEIVFDRESLGGAVGKSPLSALGITEEKLASRVKELIATTE